MDAGEVYDEFRDAFEAWCHSVEPLPVTAIGRCVLAAAASGKLERRGREFWCSARRFSPFAIGRLYRSGHLDRGEVITPKGRRELQRQWRNVANERSKLNYHRKRKGRTHEEAGNSTTASRAPL